MIIGVILFLLLAGVISRFLYTILSSSHYASMNNAYSNIKQDFKLESNRFQVYDYYEDNEKADDELLNELTYALCSMATIDSFNCTYNYGVIVDSYSGEVLRDTSEAEFLFANEYNQAPEAETEGTSTPIYMLDTTKTDIDAFRPGFEAGCSHILGSQHGLSAKDFLSCKKAFENMKKDLDEEVKRIKYIYDDKSVSSYKVTSDFFSTIYHPTVEFYLADRFESQNSYHKYDVYYYSLNTNWVTNGVTPSAVDDNNKDLYNYMCNPNDSIDDDSLIGIDETGSVYSFEMKDGVLLKQQELAGITNTNKVLVDFILRILLIAILTIIFIATAFEYFKKKSIYNQYQYRKVLMDSMAHDLKSPLMSMSGYAENLKENVRTEKRDYYADSIINNIQYMNKIINDDLEISRLDSMNKKLEKEDCDFIALLRDKLGHYQNDIDAKKISVEVSGTFPLRADVNMMGIVAENLITNCLRYCNENGTIEIVGKDKSLTIRNTTDMKYKGSMKDLWEPFVKGDSSRSGRNGTGLGLAIVAKILDRHKMKYKLSYNKSEKKFSCTIKK